MLLSVAGRLVPFTPRTLAPIRPLKGGGAVARDHQYGSLNLGASAIGAPGCPSGEQIKNGGFETGNLTGWTQLWPVTVDTSAPFSSPTFPLYPHSGSYLVWDYESGIIAQTLAKPVPVGCVKSFTLWTAAASTYGAGANVTVYYADGTNDTQILLGYGGIGWQQLSYTNFTAGKTINSVQIFFANSYDFEALDDVSLKC